MATTGNVSKRRNSEDFNALPLDVLEIEVVTKQGKAKRVPALHKGFADGRLFVPYAPLPGDPQDVIAQEQWKERSSYLLEDLLWLLKLPHHRFWSQVVYHENLHSCLLSYLSHAPRPFDTNYQKIPEDLLTLLGAIHRTVFLIYLRMSTYKENKSCHISPGVFGELIYNHYLFDIPKLMDLCALYGQSNGALLQKMLQNIFTSQPQYLDDIEDVAPTLLKVFDSVMERLGLHHEGDDSESSKEEDGADGLSSFAEQPFLSTWDLKDIIAYLADTSWTLLSFLDAYPPACKLLHDNNAERIIAQFYEQVFPRILEHLEKLKKGDIINKEEAQLQLVLTKCNLLRLFRDILSVCCIQPILEASYGASADPSLLQTHVSEFLQILQMCLADKQFICDYHQNFPIEEDIDILNQTNCELDAATTNFVLQSIRACCQGSNQVPSPELKLEKSIILQKPVNSQFQYHVGNSDIEDSIHFDLEGACAGPRMEGVQLESLVCHVQSVLPDFGEGFIESCLEYYNYNCEVVLDHLLRQDLPKALQDLDKTMPKKSSAKPVEVESIGLLAERKNVFDGDEFDVFATQNSTVDRDKVHKGKKNDVVATILDDKSQIKKSKDLYNKYDMVVEEGLGLGDIYEDEYDDTYDSLGGWAEEPVTPDPLQERRAFTVPRVLRGKDYISEEEEEEEVKPDPWTDQTKDSSRSGPQRRTQKQEMVNGAGVRGPQGQQPQQKKQWNNVQGKPKGQGQDEKTQQGRSQKEKHKGTYANHNRRAGADRKRNQGMVHI